MEQQISGQIVDVIQGRIFSGSIYFDGEKIKRIEEVDVAERQFIMPGLVDAHVHVESSMLVPSEFARMAVVHGTVCTVSDPHEIANVLGMKGVEYMLKNAAKVPFYFHFGAPSCVPATPFETAGAELGPKEVEELLKRDDIGHLAEMMNYPGVLQKDKDVMAKIAAAKKLNKPIDGHAPGLKGVKANAYAAAGISTDHECFTIEEAQDKLAAGMKILIREGSAAKNFEALIDLFDEAPEKLMFCSDDKHPDDLIQGHINQLLARGVAKGKDAMNLIKAATINPKEHYGLKNGMLQCGDAADFVCVKDLKQFEVLSTYIKGQKVSENGETLIDKRPINIVNNFNCETKKTEDFSFSPTAGELDAIEIVDGQIVTQRASYHHTGGEFKANTECDFLKIVLVNRYRQAPVSKAIVHKSTLKRGAIASSVGHDSHNIIAIGTTDEELKEVVNGVINNKGGVAAFGKNELKIVPLPIAGLMSNQEGSIVAKKYQSLDAWVKDELGCELSAPFMTLSFLALLVIPELKISDKGLFDGSSFEFIKQE